MKKLYPHQVEGSAFLASKLRAYLGDEMGLGKSVQAAHAAGMVGSRDSLVVCPAAAIPNWKHEWRTWGPTNGRRAFISYANQRHLDLAARANWDTIILDEAHYVKTPQARRTQAIEEVIRTHPDARIWPMSGTPMPNHPGELFTLFRALWPHALEGLGVRYHHQWMDLFCHTVPTPYGPKVVGAKNLHLLRPYTSGILLRRRLIDVALDLPPLRVDLHRLPDDGGCERVLEQQGVDVDALQFALQFEELSPDGSTSRLRRLLGEYKAPRILDQIHQELTERQYNKIVVLAHHRSVLDRARSMLAEHGVADGTVSAAKRQGAIDAFKSNPSARVFVAQMQAAGVALNLQVATEIALLEPAWSPDDNAQAIKRIHRIGQEHPCRARIFTFGALDEAIMGVILRKLRMQHSLGLK